MKYYAISDVHGYYTYMMKALSEAGFFSDKEPCKLIICGDLLDRGGEARRVIKLMLRLAKEKRLVYIRGNHEELFVQCLFDISHGGIRDIASGRSYHYQNGTWDSLLQIAEMSEDEAYGAPNELVRRVTSSPFYKKLLPLCRNYYETPHYVFTHGWLPCITEGSGAHIKYRYDPRWRRAGERAWSDARWLNGMELACKRHITVPDKTVVCGHFHTSYGHSRIKRICSEWGKDAVFSPFRAKGILAIDACAAHSAKINCVVIED